MNPIVEQALLDAAKKVEENLDDKIDYYDKVKDDEDELRKIRERRLKQLKHKMREKQKWKIEGHGKIHYINDHKDFMENVKRNKRVVAFFFRSGSQYCDVMDQHIRKLCAAHLETKFIYVDAEKAQVLVKYFRIWMLPSCVLIKDEESDHTIVGMDELGGNGNFRTSQLEQIMIKHKALKPLQVEDDD